MANWDITKEGSTTNYVVNYYVVNRDFLLDVEDNIDLIAIYTAFLAILNHHSCILCMLLVFENVGLIKMLFTYPTYIQIWKLKK